LIVATDDGTITEWTKAKLLAGWPVSGRCPQSGKKAKPTIDHIVPLAKGGKHTLANLQLMCALCNSIKQACE
jgi:5-methylcytosine-specific restriction endonuclease McrA